MKTALTVFALIFGLSFSAIAKPKRSANSQKQRTQTAARFDKVATQAAAFNGSKVAEAPLKPVEALLVSIVDSSPSVRAYWKEMRQAAKDIIADAPEQSSV